MKNDTSEKLLVFEEQAFPHTDELYHFGLSLTGNAADTDELLQETYLKAYRFWDTYDHGADTRAWLFRILKNSFLNSHRQESRNTG
jgi:RNA polymerase sigma-70 factor (ECF subfamily)